MLESDNILRTVNRLVFALFFVSGFSALVLQVVWMRELSLVFGATAHAAAATLAAFFLGLATGSRYWGRLSRRVASPLRAYALLEIGVVVAASAGFLLIPTFEGLYAALYDHWAGGRPGLLLTAKLLLALVLLSPAAFFMGGTLPVLSTWLVRHPADTGRHIPLLYGVNTAGAAVGTFSTAFLLPPLLGYDGTYLLAMALTGGVALAAWLLAAKQSVALEEPSAPSPRGARGHTPRNRRPLPAGALNALAFLSGFVTLALEVLWTRMFAQVLQNSVYSYAVILVVFLLALASGSFVAARLARRDLPTVPTLALLLCGAALLVALTPQIFFWLTDGLSYLGSDQGWPSFLKTLAGTAVITLAPPTIVLGVVFPYLWKIAGAGGKVGETVGRLLALNTLGAIVGALGAGFVLLEWLGLWRSILWLSGLYLAAAALLPTLAVTDPHRPARWRPILAAVPLLGFLLLLSALDVARLPVVRIDPVRRAEALLEMREGGSATVAVVRRDGHLGIKVDNHYTLGSTRGLGLQQRQAHFPLLMHPEPKRVLFLGMGTGISAGAALAHPTERIVVTELLGDVIDLARRHFGRHTQGLFDDPRVQLIAEDGRHHLSAIDDTYDVVIGDLFVPWKRGNAALYSLEHFRNVAERLAPDGLFAQWVPLYQLTEQELGIIARTFAEVFPDVTLWRGDFLPAGPIVALVGRTQDLPLDPTAVLHRARSLTDTARDADAAVLPDPETPPLLLYYAGHLSRADALLRGYPLNTDDRPRLQFRAARSQQATNIGKAWFVGEPLVAYFRRLLELSPPQDDPYLALLAPRQRAAVEAGLDIFEARLANERKDDEGARALLARASARLAPDKQPATPTTELRRELQSELQSELLGVREERDAAIGELERRIERLEHR